MIRAILFGLLAVGAMAQFPGFMGGLGGFDLTNLPEGTMDMLKNLKPDDIKNALKNMPPEMMEMAKGMGLTEEKIQEAVNNMPEDFDVSTLMSGMEDKKEAMKSNIMKEFGEMQDKMKEEALPAFTEKMKEMGIDLSEGPEGFQAQVIPKITEMMGKDLRYQGIDTDDREQIRQRVNMELRMMVGAKEDTSDEEVRELLKKKIAEEMKEDGIELDQDDLKGGLKKHILGHLKEMGLNMENGFDKNSLKEMMQNAMRSPIFRNSQEMVQQAPVFRNPQEMVQQHDAPTLNLNIDITV